VNQNGIVQPIGGVNEKIEGFYDVCKAKGFTGKQGVCIPHSNVGDLMLKQEVVDAVKSRKFHVYAVKTIDEGIELLTGKKAGTKRKTGFEKNSVNYLVVKQLDEYASRLKGFSRDSNKEKEKEKDSK
jgi:predicted ATP-dependent protease